MAYSSAYQITKRILSNLLLVFLESRHFSYKTERNLSEVMHVQLNSKENSVLQGISHKKILSKFNVS